MIRVAGFEKESFTDGPGVRYALFVQGCKHDCDGCHNKQTHDFNGGTPYTVDYLVEDIKSYDSIDGVTLSGGDPLFQAEECAELAHRIKTETSLNIWCYTGFEFEELVKSKNESIQKLLSNIDVMVDSKFEKKHRNLGLRFRGSSNQRIIDVKESVKSNKIIVLELDE